VLISYQQRQNSTYKAFLGFVVNSLSPLVLQCFETATRPVAKTIQHLEPVLHFAKACLLLIKLGLVKLLTALQDLFVGFRWVDEDHPFTIADDKLMDGLATMSLPLSGPQPAKEGFQLIVGAPAFGPGITLEEPWPALIKGSADMCDHIGILRVVLRVLVQLSQELFDLALDPAAGRAWVALVCRRVETAIQFHQPATLALELPIL
jgi:hypothetical protein